MSIARLADRAAQLNAAMADDNPTDRLVAGMLLHVQEFIRSSGINADFMGMDVGDLVRLAKQMGITQPKQPGRTVVHRAIKGDAAA
jgi:hypothetical protein